MALQFIRPALVSRTGRQPVVPVVRSGLNATTEPTRRNATSIRNVNARQR